MKSRRELAKIRRAPSPPAELFNPFAAELASLREMEAMEPHATRERAPRRKTQKKRAAEAGVTLLRVAAGKPGKAKDGKAKAPEDDDAATTVSGGPGRSSTGLGSDGGDWDGLSPSEPEDEGTPGEDERFVVPDPFLGGARLEEDDETETSALGSEDGGGSVAPTG